MNRRVRTDYFPPVPGAPPPLVVECRRRVRFEECDPLGMVWHGRYAGFFEDGRAAFGEKHGLSYMNMYESNFLAPIVQLHVEFFQPLRFPEEMLIRAELCWTEAARLNFQYRISGTGGEPAAAGITIQLLTARDLQPLLVRPPLLEEFWRRWSGGELE
jgi:acyl-CoA thioester hydrolase